MARSPENAVMQQTHGYDTLSALQQDSNGIVHDLRVEDNDYHEVNMTQYVPTKTGEEDEVLIDSDRPGSAGTGHSVPMTEYDEKVLRDTAPSSKLVDDLPSPQPEGTLMFSRSSIAVESDTPSSFSFGKASKQHMDFVGTRKAPAVKVADERPEAAHPQVDAVQVESTPMIAESSAPQQEPPEPSEPSRSEPEAARSVQEASILQHGEGIATHGRKNPKRGKGKRASKPQSLPPPKQPDEEEHYASPASVVQHDHALAEVSRHGQGEEHLGDAMEDIVVEHGEERRPVTPPRAQPQTLIYDTRSPCDQLHEETEVAAQRASCSPQSQHFAVMEHLDEQHLRHPSMLPTPQTQAPQQFSPEDAEFPGAHADLYTTNTPAPTKAKKKRSMSSRKAPAPAPASFASNTVTDSDSDINDYIQILQYKIREQSQHTISRVTAERDSIQQELEQILETERSLQDELARVKEVNDSLSTTTDRQKIKLAAYEQRVNKFKTFVNGLGHDVDALKKEANATRRKGEELLHESQECKAEREALLEQMNNCTERSAQLKNEAFKACSEMQSELQTAILRANYLDQQLSEKVGLLAEERDRRAQLERRMLSAPDPSETISRNLKASSDLLLDKLHIMHATLENNDSVTKLSELVGKTYEAIQTVNAHNTTHMDNAASTKSLVEALGDRFSAFEHQASVQPFKEQLDEVLLGLKNIADSQADRIRQDAAHREAVSGFQEKLQGSEHRLAQAEGELNLMQDREGRLKEDNQKLQNTLAAIQSQATPAENTEVNVDQVRSDLLDKTKALETARSDLASKASELEVMKKTNQDLQTTMQSLRDQVQKLEQTTRELCPDKAAVEQTIRDETERIRAESLKHSQDYRAQLEMESKNQLRKLTSDRDRYEKQVTPLKSELASSRKLIEELQQKLKEGTATSQQVERMTKLAESRSKEIETLKASLKEMQKSAEVDASMREKLESVSIDLETEKAKLQDALQTRTSLKKQADEQQHAACEARKACEQLEVELTTHRANSNSQLEKLDKELKAAQETARRAEAGRDHFKKSCDSAMENEATKTRRQIEDLQTELAQAKRETDQEKADAGDFRVNVDKQWQIATAEHNQQIDDLRNQIETAENAKNQALESSERTLDERRTLLEQIDALKQRADSAEDKLNAQQGAASTAPEGLPRLEVPSLSEGITPSGTVRTAAPTKPRKKVDRNQNTTIDGPPVKAIDEALRPDSRQANSSGDKLFPKRAVIEDSQATEPQALDEHSGITGRMGSANFAMFSDVDDMTNGAELYQSQHPVDVVEETQLYSLPSPSVLQARSPESHTQVVEETQLDDSLPSFSAFSRSLANTQTAKTGPMISSTLSLPYQRDRGMTADVDYESSRGVQQSSAGADDVAKQAATGFSIFEDSSYRDTQGENTQGSHPSVHLQDDWSQEERDRYTFRKAHAPPNSASKLVRANSTSTVGSTRRISGLTDRAPLMERRLKTPEVRGESARLSQRGSAYSSSPAYVQPAPSRPARTYSNTPAGVGSGKRRSSRTQKMSAQDPRLAGRKAMPTPKRKAENSVVEGYEHERKKRLSAAANAPSSDATRFSSRLSSQQSISDLPGFPKMPANPRGSSSQSRLRTLGGNSSRAPTSKKMSKGDEMSNRFSQEMNRR